MVENLLKQSLKAQNLTGDVGDALHQLENFMKHSNLEYNDSLFFSLRYLVQTIYTHLVLQDYSNVLYARLTDRECLGSDSLLLKSRSRRLFSKKSK